MKKEFIKPQLKICYLEFIPLMDQTTTDVHTDNPQDPGGALGNSNNVWEEEKELPATDNSPSVWEE